MTMTTTSPPPTTADLARLRVAVEAADRRRRLFARIQPVGGWAATSAGTFDPSRLIQKFETEAELDRLRVELASAEAAAARQRLADLGGDDAAAMARAAEDAERAAAEARATAKAATEDANLCRDAVDRHRERTAAALADLSRAEGDGRRWASELERDVAHLARYASLGRATGVVG